MEVNNCAVPTCQRPIRLDHAFCLWHYSHLPADDRRRMAALIEAARHGEESPVYQLGEFIGQCCGLIRQTMKVPQAIKA